MAEQTIELNGITFTKGPDGQWLNPANKQPVDQYTLGLIQKEEQRQQQAQRQQAKQQQIEGKTNTDAGKNADGTEKAAQEQGQAASNTAGGTLGDDGSTERNILQGMNQFGQSMQHGARDIGFSGVKDAGSPGREALAQEKDQFGAEMKGYGQQEIGRGERNVNAEASERAATESAAENAQNVRNLSGAAGGGAAALKRTTATPQVGEVKKENADLRKTGRDTLETGEKQILGAQALRTDAAERDKTAQDVAKYEAESRSIAAGAPEDAEVLPDAPDEVLDEAPDEEKEETTVTGEETPAPAAAAAEDPVTGEPKPVASEPPPQGKPFDISVDANTAAKLGLEMYKPLKEDEVAQINSRIDQMNASLPPEVPKETHIRPGTPEAPRYFSGNYGTTTHFDDQKEQVIPDPVATSAGLPVGDTTSDRRVKVIKQRMDRIISDKRVKTRTQNLRAGLSEMIR
jgi:hypothetical protein